MAHSLPTTYQQISQERQGTNPSVGRGASDRPSSALLFANAFTIPLSDAWTNETVYVIDAPTGEHSLQISVDPGVSSVAVVDYANAQLNWQRQARTEEQFLFQQLTSLDNDLPAYWVVSQWKPPEDEVRIQHQCFVIHDGTGYRLSTSFRKPMRAVVEPTLIGMIRSFEPHPPLRERF